MSKQGAVLQTYNNELIKCIEDLCSKRDEVHQQIVLVEEEKQKIQNDIRILTDRLAQVNESLAKKIATRNDYDKTIAECETAYRKILESSQTLLHVLKKESTSLKEKSSIAGAAPIVSSNGGQSRPTDHVTHPHTHTV